MRSTYLALIVMSGFFGCQRNDDVVTYRIYKDSSTATRSLPPNSMAQMGESLGLKASGNTRDIQWVVPRGWEQLPATAMRIGNFRVTGEGGGTAEVSIVPLSGPAGGDLANINRWRGQIELPPLSESDLSAQVHSIKAAGRAMRLVDFVGPKPTTGSPKRVLAAIYQRGDRSWFFKMTGDAATIESAKPDFLKFLNTLRFSDGH
jgi:hypothetical protein